MGLTDGLGADRRATVEARLKANLIAWLTTVRPDGQPVSVPVWFVHRDDGTIVVYSQPGAPKLANIERNDKVALGLDVTDLGRDIVRIHGTATVTPALGPADECRDYVVKYKERIGAMFGTADRFAAAFSVPVLITPTRLWG